MSGKKKCQIGVRPARERRVALDTRRRVSQMQPEEMRRLLLISDVTGLPNRRAFEEAGPASAVAMSDLDGLKALNDRYGYDFGNAFLRAKACALREAGLDAFHDKGDEFLYRGTDLTELLAKLEWSRAILRKRLVIVERPDGEIVKLTGGDFSYGVGKDLHEAEVALKCHKLERKARGKLERGDLRDIRRVAQKGNVRADKDTRIENPSAATRQSGDGAFIE